MMSRQILQSLVPDRDPKVRATAFGVARFLKQVAAGETADPWALESLCKKVDVARRVFEFYDVRLARPVTDALLDVTWLPLLGGVLLHEAERRQDFKLLNSAIKLQHGVLIEPSFSGHPALGAWIDRQLAVPMSPCVP